MFFQNFRPVTNKIGSHHTRCDNTYANISKEKFFPELENEILHSTSALTFFPCPNANIYGSFDAHYPWVEFPSRHQMDEEWQSGKRPWHLLSQTPRYFKQQTDISDNGQTHNASEGKAQTIKSHQCHSKHCAFEPSTTHRSLYVCCRQCNRDVASIAGCCRLAWERMQLLGVSIRCFCVNETNSSEYPWTLTKRCHPFLPAPHSKQVPEKLTGNVCVCR